jgi:hypothetical protein
VGSEVDDELPGSAEAVAFSDTRTEPIRISYDL